MIYLATPYSHPDPAVMQARFERACKIAGAMIAKRKFVFSPIVHRHSIAAYCNLSQGCEYWDRYDWEMIGNTDKVVVVRMDGWEDSPEVEIKIALARRLGVPVEFVEE